MASSKNSAHETSAVQYHITVSERLQQAERAPGWLRGLLISAALLGLGVSAADAEVLISVNKSTQHMTVSVDGTPRYNFVVSTGRPGYGTPSGTYHPQRMERTWFSKEYYNSPMPYSIFFHGGFAIHGSYEINRLGAPRRMAASGCILQMPRPCTVW